MSYLGVKYSSMKTLLILFIIFYLPVTLLMYTVNLGDMIDARRAWIKCRERFYSQRAAGDPYLPMTADVLLAAVDAYEDTLDAMWRIWQWPWLLLVALWECAEGVRRRLGGARVEDDRRMMGHDVAACGLISEVTDE